MADAESRIVVASGGTGGHFYPALAIARECRNRGRQVTLLLAGQHVADQLEVMRQEGLAAAQTRAVRLPRNAWQALLFVPRLVGAVWHARRQLQRLKPAVVLGMGSFAAVPVCLAGVSLRLPLVLHEANAWIGRANRFLARWARVLATSLPVAPGQKCRCPQVRTGMPLRQDLVRRAFEQAVPAGFLTGLGLVESLPVLLVFGGSQGAEALNALMVVAAGRLGDAAGRFQVIHLTGTEDNDLLLGAYAAAGIRASVRPADMHIENCYAAADLVLCRAGASTLSELALFGKPAILVPFPHSAEDHQAVNARTLADMGAAHRLPEVKATPAAVTTLLRDWLQDPAPWRQRGDTVRALACPDAAAAVVTLLEQILAGHAPGSGRASVLTPGRHPDVRQDASVTGPGGRNPA